MTVAPETLISMVPFTMVAMFWLAVLVGNYVRDVLGLPDENGVRHGPPGPFQPVWVRECRQSLNNPINNPGEQ